MDGRGFPAIFNFSWEQWIYALRSIGYESFLSTFEKHVAMASAHNQSMIDDLDEIRNLMMTIDSAVGDPEIEETLQ
jgi:hypothetical protein